MIAMVTPIHFVRVAKVKNSVKQMTKKSASKQVDKTTYTEQFIKPVKRVTFNKLG
jgi:hypothetical protein